VGFDFAVVPRPSDALHQRPDPEHEPLSLVHAIDGDSRCFKLGISRVPEANRSDGVLVGLGLECTSPLRWLSVECKKR